VGQVRLFRAPPDPGESAAGALALAMVNQGVGGPVLFPCGDRRRDELPSLLRSHGIEVDEVVCYHTVLAGREEAERAVIGSSILVVASPSVVGLLVEVCSNQPRPRLVAVGETTAASARAAGWQPAAVAVEPSTSALVSAISGLLATR
jgi:uroporphyrinogen-III synthase